MIGTHEIKEIARKNGIPSTTIERDYVQNFLLKSLYSKTDALVFKGGTAIRKAFVQDYRFSDDLDFTLSKHVNREEMAALFAGIINDISEEGIIFEEGVEFKAVATGWKIKMHHTSGLSKNTRIKMFLDITNPNLELVITPVEHHQLIHNYSDVCKAKLITYSLSEITAEKLRALCDRGWPRDLYDVNNLWPQIEKLGIQELFSRKCRIRGLEPTLDKYKQNKERIRSAWSKSLEHQLKVVPDFNETFQGVLTILESLNVV